MKKAILISSALVVTLFAGKNVELANTQPAQVPVVGQYWPSNIMYLSREHDQIEFIILRE